MADERVLRECQAHKGLGPWAGLQLTDVSEAITAMAEAKAAAPLGPNLVDRMARLDRSSVARLLLSLRPTESASTPSSPKSLSPSDNEVSEGITAMAGANTVAPSAPSLLKLRLICKQERHKGHKGRHKHDGQ